MDSTTYNKQSSVLPIQEPDYTSALALTESRTIIDSLFLDLCGIKEIQAPNGTSLFRRISKPVFTYDYANRLLNGSYAVVNRVTARTTYTDRQIKKYMYLLGKDLMFDLAIVGFRNIVSDAVWKKALEFSKPIPLTDSKNQPIFDFEKKQIYTNDWFKAEIPWKYDDPFTIDHLDFLKKKFPELADEHFGQDIMMKSVFWRIMTFEHGGLNRSNDSLTLDHEKVVHKENTIFSEATSNRPNEAALQSIRDRFSGFSGGQKK